MEAALRAAVRDLVHVAHAADDAASRPAVAERLDAAETLAAWLVDNLAGHPTPHLPAGSGSAADTRHIAHFLATQLDGIRAIIPKLDPHDPRFGLIGECVPGIVSVVRQAAEAVS